MRTVLSRCGSLARRMHYRRFQQRTTPTPETTGRWFERGSRTLGKTDLCRSTGKKTSQKFCQWRVGERKFDIPIARPNGNFKIITSFIWPIKNTIFISARVDVKTFQILDRSNAEGSWIDLDSIRLRVDEHQQDISRPVLLPIAASIVEGFQSRELGAREGPQGGRSLRGCWGRAFVRWGRGRAQVSRGSGSRNRERTLEEKITNEVDLFGASPKRTLDRSRWNYNKNKDLLEKGRWRGQTTVLRPAAKNWYIDWTTL